MKVSELQNLLINKLRRKVTLTEIAGALNLDKSSLSWMQKENRDIKPHQLIRIEDYYEIKINDNANDLSDDKETCVTLERIGIAPSCGSGTAVFDDAEITPVLLGKKLIEKILRISNTDGLKVFRASGDSMEPVIYDNDDLLVDITRKDFNNGGIFVLTINNDWFIKRLRLQINGNLEIISDNIKYPPETKHPDDDININIIGRVIKNLSRGL